VKFILTKKRLFLVIVLICFFPQLLGGQERPEIEVRKKGGILFREMTYTISTTSTDEVNVNVTFDIENVGTDPVDSLSFDILVTSGELLIITFSSNDNQLNHQQSLMEAHYLFDVDFHQTLNPTEAMTIQGEYALSGILEQDDSSIRTRVPLLVPIITEASGKTQITISMKGPAGFKCAQAIPQPTSRNVEDDFPMSTWKMSMIPPSLLFITYKPIGTTSISFNTLILIGILLWGGLVAVYGYRKLR
jgi:hypothetical protein